MTELDHAIIFNRLMFDFGEGDILFTKNEIDIKKGNPYSVYVSGKYVGDVKYLSELEIIMRYNMPPVRSLIAELKEILKNVRL